MIRHPLITRLALIACAASGWVATPTWAAERPTVILVHGAFVDGSDWAKVVTRLEAQGVHAVAVQEPLTSLADDVAVTRRAIAAQPGKVVLVGHSWGGTVITQAGDSDQVAALVYVAAFAPDVGQSAADTGKGFPTPPGLAFIKPDRDGYLHLSAEGMSHYFAPDLPPAVHDQMIDPSAQRALAKRMDAHVSTVQTSHVAGQVAPDQVAAVILDAVKASSR